MCHHVYQLRFTTLVIVPLSIIVSDVQIVDERMFVVAKLDPQLHNIVQMSGSNSDGAPNVGVLSRESGSTIVMSRKVFHRFRSEVSVSIDFAPRRRDRVKDNRVMMLRTTVRATSPSQTDFPLWTTYDVCRVLTSDEIIPIIDETFTTVGAISSGKTGDVRVIRLR